MASNLWNESEIELLVDLWGKGFTTKQVAHELGRTSAQVRVYVSRHREELNLERRSEYFRVMTPTSSVITEFEKEWQGSVPYLHWSITKPWGAR